MVTILMMSAKMTTLGLLKIKIFLNEDYDVIFFVYDVTNKILSRDSIYVVNVVMWPKSGNSNLNFIRIWPEKLLFWGLELGIALKFYTSLAKE